MAIPRLARDATTDPPARPDPHDTVRGSRTPSSFGMSGSAPSPSVGYRPAVNAVTANGRGLERETAHEPGREPRVAEARARGRARQGDPGPRRARQGERRAPAGGPRSRGPEGIVREGHRLEALRARGDHARPRHVDLRARAGAR